MLTALLDLKIQLKHLQYLENKSEKRTNLKLIATTTELASLRFFILIIIVTLRNLHYLANKNHQRKFNMLGRPRK